MGGLLCGVLLARVFAGLIADRWGWRALYSIAAILMLALGIALAACLPRHPPVVRMSYGRLMRSLGALLREHPALRNASWVSALSFAAFSAFWTTLSFLLASRFHQGASAAGMFGIVGIIGAAAAPWAGRLSDRKGFGFTITLSLALIVLAFVTMELWVAIWALIIGVLFMDLGVQSVQVAAQAQVISLAPDARSRLNTLYMVARFTGGATGSALGALAWTRWQWPGVCIFCLALTLLAWFIHAPSPRRAE
jgi:predicted MFS family arabinose efflux permease